MHLLGPESLAAFVHHFGLVAVFLIIALESTGIPLPGEATLVTAALVASTTHELSVPAVVATAAAAAILGDNLGYAVGRRYGADLLVRYGPRMGLSPPRLKLGRYVFQQHGGMLVFFGRFVALFRAFAAVLAGSNAYPWPRFLVFNAAGGILWASVYGFGAAFFGRAIHKVAAPAAVLILCVAAVAMVLAWRTMKRHEVQLMAKAEAAFPGPLA